MLSSLPRSAFLTSSDLHSSPHLEPGFINPPTLDSSPSPSSSSGTSLGMVSPVEGSSSASSNHPYSHVHPSQLHGDGRGNRDTGHSFYDPFASSAMASSSKDQSLAAGNFSTGDYDGMAQQQKRQSQSHSQKQAKLRTKSTAPNDIPPLPAATHSDPAQQDDETLSPAEQRRLKRKEQNRMAQRRHREKQRSQMRRQRQGSRDEAASPPESDPGESSNHTSNSHPTDNSVTSPPPYHQTPQLQYPHHSHPAFSDSRGLQIPADIGPPLFMSDASPSSLHHQHLSSYPDGSNPTHHHPHHLHASGHNSGAASSVHVPEDQFDYSLLLNGDSNNNNDTNHQHSAGSSLSVSQGDMSSHFPSHSMTSAATIRSSELHSSPTTTDFYAHPAGDTGRHPISPTSGGYDAPFGTAPYASSPGQRVQDMPQTSSDQHRQSFARLHGGDQHAQQRIPASGTVNGDGAEGEDDGGKKRKRSAQGHVPVPGTVGYVNTLSRPMSNTDLLKYFASLTSLQIPWADQLLSPRWDLIKVLQMASSRLGLMFEYVEGDDSVSFLAQDFYSATRGLGRGPATSGPGQTELGKWPTEENPGVQVHSPAGLITKPSSPSSHDDAGSYGTERGGPVLRWKDVPHNMRPSRLSGVVQHHPYIDLSFPWPTFRDRILAAMSCHLLHEVDLCMEIWPGEDLQPEGAEPPYWIHGDDPFDPESYEVSDRLAKRYPWLLDSAIIRRTNWWRRQQSKAELPAMVSDVSRLFAPFFQQQIEHLQDPERVPFGGQLPHSLNQSGIGSMFAPLGQVFDRANTAEATSGFAQHQQRHSGRHGNNGSSDEEGHGARITAVEKDAIDDSGSAAGDSDASNGGRTKME